MSAKNVDLNNIAVEMVLAGNPEGYVEIIKNSAESMPTIKNLMIEWHNLNDDELRKYVYDAIRFLLGDETLDVLM